jgi:hypothetical protein
LTSCAEPASGAQETPEAPLAAASRRPRPPAIEEPSVKRSFEFQTARAKASAWQRYKCIGYRTGPYLEVWAAWS